MNIPKKKKLQIASTKNPTTYMSYELGYNKAYEDWEKFLPNEQELSDIVYCVTQYLPNSDIEVTILNDRIVKRIIKRLKGK